MQLTVNLGDQVIARLGNQLGALGDGKARTIMSRALNHEGDKGRTLVRRRLVEQTGMKYGRVVSATKSIYSSPSTLAYTLTARGGETNIGAFGARQLKKGVSAAPWGNRRIFAHTFLLKTSKGISGASGLGGDLKGKLVAFVRIGKGKNDFRAAFGPNIARELLRDESREVFLKGSAGLAAEIARQLAREIV